MMEGSVSPNMESQLKPSHETHASKKRKLVEKIVVTVKVGENGGKLKNEGPPSDLWSWRKYGQKPIKGSPYPRGYYRCSTSKGCSAKKRVEICKTDASMLVITYTSTHNHPGPDLDSTDTKQFPKQPQSNLSDDDDDDKPSTPKQEMVPEVQKEPNKTTSDEEASEEEEHNFHYLQSPLRFPQNVIISQEDPFMGNLEKIHDTLGFLLDEEPPLSCFPYVKASSSSTPKSEENDFFDELEELPICSAFTSFMRSNKFFDEGIPVFPS